MNFDPDKLEVAVNPNGGKGGRARQWKWMVCEVSGPPIKSGIVTGAESKAWDAGNAAMTQLIAEFHDSKAK